MASWRIRFHDKWPHLASLYASTHNLDEDGKYPDPIVGQDNIFDPSEPYGAYRYYVQPSSRSEFSIEEPGYMHRSMYKDEESRSSDYTSGDSFRRGATCRVCLCVFLVFSFIGIVVAAVTLAVLLSQTPRPLPEKTSYFEEFESTASIYAHDFNEQLLDNSTDEFKQLEEDFCKAIEQMFTDSDSPVKNAFGGCEVVEFINGSLQVKYRLKLSTKSHESFKMDEKILRRLEEHFAKKVNEIGPWQRLKFNPGFFKKFIRIEQPTTTVQPVTSTKRTTTVEQLITDTTKPEIQEDLSTKSPIPESSVAATSEDPTSKDITTDPSATEKITPERTAIVNITSESPAILTEMTTAVEKRTSIAAMTTEATTEDVPRLSTEVIKPSEPTASEIDIKTTQSDITTDVTSTLRPTDMDTTGYITTTSGHTEVTEFFVTDNTQQIVDNITLSDRSTEASAEETSTTIFDLFYNYNETYETTEQSRTATTENPTTATVDLVDVATTSEDVLAQATGKDVTSSVAQIAEISTQIQSDETSPMVPTVDSRENVTEEQPVETSSVIAAKPQSTSFTVPEVIKTTPISKSLQTTVQEIATTGIETQDLTTTDTLKSTERFDITSILPDTITDFKLKHTDISATHITEKEINTNEDTTIEISTYRPRIELNITSATTLTEKDEFTTFKVTAKTNITKPLELTTFPPKDTTTHVQQETTKVQTIMDTFKLTQAKTEYVTKLMTEQQPTEGTVFVTEEATTLDSTKIDISPAEMIQFTETVITSKILPTTTEGLTVDSGSLTSEVVPDINLTKSDAFEKATGETYNLTTPDLLKEQLSTDSVSDTGVISDLHTTTPDTTFVTPSLHRKSIVSDSPAIIDDVTETLEGVSEMVLLNDTDTYMLNESEIYLYGTTTTEKFFVNLTTQTTFDDVTSSETQTSVRIQDSTETPMLMTEMSTEIEQPVEVTTIQATDTTKSVSTEGRSFEEVLQETTHESVLSNATEISRGRTESETHISTFSVSQEDHKLTLPEGTTSIAKIAETTATDDKIKPSTDDIASVTIIDIEATQIVSSDIPVTTRATKVNETSTSALKAETESTGDIVIDNISTETITKQTVESSQNMSTQYLSTDIISAIPTTESIVSHPASTGAKEHFLKGNDTSDHFISKTAAVDHIERHTVATVLDGTETAGTLGITPLVVTTNRISTEPMTTETTVKVITESTPLYATSTDKHPIDSGTAEQIFSGAVSSAITPNETAAVTYVQSTTVSVLGNATTIERQLDQTTTSDISKSDVTTHADVPDSTTINETRNETFTTETPANATESVDTVTKTKTTKSAEAAFLDEYGEAAFIEEYVPGDVNITEETSVISASNETYQSTTTMSTGIGTTSTLIITENVSIAENFTDSYTSELPFVDNITLAPTNETWLIDNEAVLTTKQASSDIVLNRETSPYTTTTEFQQGTPIVTSLGGTTIVTATIEDKATDLTLTTDSVLTANDTMESTTYRNETNVELTEQLTTQSPETFTDEPRTTKLPVTNHTITTTLVETTATIRDEQNATQFLQNETITESAILLKNKTKVIDIAKNEMLSRTNISQSDGTTEPTEESQTSNMTTESPSSNETTSYYYNTSEYYTNYTADYFYEYYNITTESPIPNITEASKTLQVIDLGLNQTKTNASVDVLVVEAEHTLIDTTTSHASVLTDSSTEIVTDVSP